jgi:hypothetical protein
MEQNEVTLLYEGDEWLSMDSLVLMGIFTSEETFKANAEKLIRQRAKQHVRDAEAMGYDFDDCESRKDKEDSVCDDILLELCSRGSTSGWTTNYTSTMVELDKLEEI